MITTERAPRPRRIIVRRRGARRGGHREITPEPAARPRRVNRRRRGGRRGGHRDSTAERAARGRRLPGGRGGGRRGPEPGGPRLLARRAPDVSGNLVDAAPFRYRDPRDARAPRAGPSRCGPGRRQWGGRAGEGRPLGPGPNAPGPGAPLLRPRPDGQARARRRSELPRRGRGRREGGAQRRARCWCVPRREVRSRASGTSTPHSARGRRRISHRRERERRTGFFVRRSPGGLASPVEELAEAPERLLLVLGDVGQRRGSGGHIGNPQGREGNPETHTLPLTSLSQAKQNSALLVYVVQNRTCPTRRRTSATPGLPFGRPLRT